MVPGDASPIMTALDQSQWRSPSDKHLDSQQLSPILSSLDGKKNVLGFTSNLISTLEKSRLQIDAFCTRSKEKLDDVCDSSIKTFEEQQGEMNELLLKLEELKCQRGLATRVTPDHQKKITSENDAYNRMGSSYMPICSIPNQQIVFKDRQRELEKNLADMFAENQDKEKILSEAEKEEDFYRIKAEEAREAKLRVEEAKQTTVEDLSLGVLKYKKLGLNFEKVADNTLRFIFTMLDPKNPKRKFSCVLSASDDEMYELLECNPPLQENRTAFHLRHLNETSDISFFVRSMRREFKAAI